RGGSNDSLHVVVVRHGPGYDGAGRRSEYWIDGTRDLARVVYDMPQGTAVRATGADWALDIPPQGAATLYRTAAADSGQTLEITGQLYYLRDALAAGRASVVSQDSSAIVVLAGARSGM